MCVENIYETHHNSFFSMCCRSIYYLHAGVRTWRGGDRKDEKRIAKERNARSCYIRLFEACCEAAPQLAFQLYVLVVTQPPLDGAEGTVPDMRKP
jgi:hypothetical protein